MVLPLWSLAVAAPWVVSVPADTGTSSAACSARHMLTETLRQVPQTRVRRAETDADADVSVKDGIWSVRIQGQNGRGSRLEDAVRAAWPKDAPELPEALRPPDFELLRLACAGLVEQAYAQAGAAVPLTLAEMAPPPEDKPQGSLLRRWAYARGRWASGQARAALPHLRAVVKRLTEGDFGPTWRTIGNRADIPELTVAGDLVVLFDDGAFEARDLHDGRRAWTRQVGTAEPIPVVLADGILLVLGEAIMVVDARSGAIRWRAELAAPHAEVHADASTVYVADREAVIAFASGSGKIRWRYEGLPTPTAGPVAIDGRLAVPLGERIAILDLEDGSEEAVVDLDDELSAPLVATPKGGLWALMGSDEVLHIPADARRPGAKTRDLPGVTWPPTVLGETRLAVTAGRRADRTDLLYVEPKRGRITKRVRGVRPPLGVLPKSAGVIYKAREGRELRARDRSGRLRWTVRPGARIADWSAAERLAVAAGQTVRVYDPEDGKPITAVELDGRVASVVYGPFGGLAVLEDGTLYGLPAPGDPRQRVWLQEARLVLARAYAATGALSAARTTAEQAVMGGGRDLEALVLAAEMDTRLDASSSVGRWLSILRRMPDDPEVVRRAAQSLATQVGLASFVSVKAQAIRASGGVIVLRTADAIEARPVATPTQVRWRKRPGVLGETRGGALKIGDRWYRVEDGKPATEPGETPVGPTLRRRSAEAGPILVRRGETLWSKPLPQKATVIEARARTIVYGPRFVEVWSSTSGVSRWRAERRSATVDAWPTKDSLVVRTKGGLHALRWEDGRQRFRVSVPDAARVFVGGGYAVAVDGKTVSFIELERGRLRGRIRLRTPITGGWWAGGLLYVALKKGTVAAIDPQQRDVIGKAELVPRQAVGAEGRLAIINPDGDLLIFDGTRGFRAAKDER